MWRFFLGLPLDLLPALTRALALSWRAFRWALALSWRAFRWLVLAPGLWRPGGALLRLAAARAAVLAAAGAAAGVWTGGDVIGMVAAGVCLGSLGAGAAVFATLVQVEFQDNIHGD